MEGVGARLGRTSTRYGPATVFTGPVRKWRKKWVHVAPSTNNNNNNNNHSNNNHSHQIHNQNNNNNNSNGTSNGNNGAHLLLFKWTPITQSQNNNNNNNNSNNNVNGDKSDVEGAPEEQPRRKFKYIPVIIIKFCFFFYMCVCVSWDFDFWWNNCRWVVRWIGFSEMWSGFLGFCDNSGFDWLREVICDLGFWVCVKLSIFFGGENWDFWFFLGGFCGFGMWSWNLLLFCIGVWCMNWQRQVENMQDWGKENLEKLRMFWIVSY